MGTDHAIVVGYGFRIPLKLWNSFRTKVHMDWKEKQKRWWKKRKTEDSYDPEEEGSSYSENDIYQLDVETDFCKITDPDSDATFDFLSQGSYSNTLDNLYVFIVKRDDEYTSLMNRKIGGAMMGWFSRLEPSGDPVRAPSQPFDHMQGISSLEFSIDLDGGSDGESELYKDWITKDGSWSEDTLHRKDFLNFFNSLPDPLKKFLEQYPREKFYSKWLFSYAW